MPAHTATRHFGAFNITRHNNNRRTLKMPKMKSAGFGKKVESLRAAAQLPGTASGTLRHTSEFIDLILGASIHEETPQEFVKAFMDRDPVYSNTDTGLAAVQFESYLAEKDEPLYLKFMETVVQGNQTTFLVIFEGEITQDEEHRMTEAMQKVCTLKAVVKCGDKNDSEISDMTCYECTPVRKGKSVDIVSTTAPTKEDYQKCRVDGGMDERYFNALFPDNGMEPLATCETIQTFTDPYGVTWYGHKKWIPGKVEKDKHPVESTVEEEMTEEDFTAFVGDVKKQLGAPWTVEMDRFTRQTAYDVLWRKKKIGRVINGVDGVVVSANASRFGTRAGKVAPMVKGSMVREVRQPSVAKAVEYLGALLACMTRKDESQYGSWKLTPRDSGVCVTLRTGSYYLPVTVEECRKLVEKISEVYEGLPEEGDAMIEAFWKDYVKDHGIDVSSVTEGMEKDFLNPRYNKRERIVEARCALRRVIEGPFPVVFEQKKAGGKGPQQPRMVKMNKETFDFWAKKAFAKLGWSAKDIEDTMKKVSYESVAEAHDDGVEPGTPFTAKIRGNYVITLRPNAMMPFFYFDGSDFRVTDAKAVKFGSETLAKAALASAAVVKAADTCTKAFAPDESVTAGKHSMDDQAEALLGLLMDREWMSEVGTEEDWRGAAGDKQNVIVYPCYAAKVRKAAQEHGWTVTPEDIMHHKNSQWYVMLLGRTSVDNYDTEMAFFKNPKMSGKGKSESVDTMSMDLLDEAAMTDVQATILKQMGAMGYMAHYPNHFFKNKYGRFQPSGKYSETDGITFRWSRGHAGATLKVIYNKGTDEYTITSGLYREGKVVELHSADGMGPDDIGDFAKWFPASDAKKLPMKEGQSARPFDTSVRETVGIGTEWDSAQGRRKIDRLMTIGGQQRYRVVLIDNPAVNELIPVVDIDKEMAFDAKYLSAKDESVDERDIAPFTTLNDPDRDIKDLDVFKNPSYADVAQLGKASAYGGLRMIVEDRGAGDVYAWDASGALHHQVTQLLHLNRPLCLEVARHGLDKGWQYNKSGSEEFEYNPAVVKALAQNKKFQAMGLVPNKYSEMPCKEGVADKIMDLIDRPIMVGRVMYRQPEQRLLKFLIASHGLEDGDFNEEAALKLIANGHAERHDGALDITPAGRKFAREKLKHTRESVQEGDAEAPVNKEAVGMLAKFIVNDMQDAYAAQVARPVALYKARGDYDAKMAPKLALHLVNSAGPLYHRKFDKGSTEPWHAIFNPKTREAVMQAVVDQAEKDAASHKWDALLPKCWQQGGEGGVKR